MRSNIPYPQFIFYEEAKHPLLTIELDTRNAPTSYLAGTGFGAGLPAHGRWLVLDKTDLSTVSLKEHPFETSINVALAQVKTLYPTMWRRLTVKAFVCDDKNQDGHCSDQSTPYDLAVATPSFTLGHLPRKVSIEVWAGRHFTVAGDPNYCEVQYSPLVLDLNGDGIQLTGPDDGVYFDLNDTGNPVATGWPIGSDDGFLVRDLNGNGAIDSGAELFGSATVMKNGQRAPNGFEALKEYDADGDGKITAKDPIWNELRIWIDRNHNGFSERRELSTLDSWRVTSIRLDYVGILEVDPYGNQTRERSLFTRLFAGQEVARQVLDIWFDTILAH